MEQLSINLASDISYVSGIVNGEEATFSLTSPGIWSATVPKAEDGRYTIEITAYNNLGTPTVYNTIIYKLEGMIPGKTNWTSNDYYNAEDLNRVEANTQFVAEYLESIDFTIPLEEVKAGRDMISIDFISSINRIERNLDSVRSNMITPPGYGPMRVWTNRIGFDYRDANRYERNLELLYKWAHLIFDSYKYCGEFVCGEDVI